MISDNLCVHACKTRASRPSRESHLSRVTLRAAWSPVLALLRAATDRLAEKAGGGESNVRVCRWRWRWRARVAEGRRRRRRRGERGRGTGGVSDRLVHVASTTRTRLGRAASGRTSQQRASPQPDTLSSAAAGDTTAGRPPAYGNRRGRRLAASDAIRVLVARVRAGRWAAAPCAVVRAGEGVGAGVGAVLGAARAARGLCAEAPAAVRWMGHASRGRRGTGQRRTSRPRPRGI